MTLRFYARGKGKVTDPRSPHNDGQLPKYVGRAWVPSDDKANRKIGAHMPTKQAYECEPGPVGLRLALLTRRDSSLWPADAETARYCQVDYVELEFVGVEGTDGEWKPKATAAPTVPSEAETLKAEAEARAAEAEAAKLAAGASSSTDTTEDESAKDAKPKRSR